eukprot:2238968-Rhodomonas_salina.1
MSGHCSPCQDSVARSRALAHVLEETPKPNTIYRTPGATSGHVTAQVSAAHGAQSPPSQIFQKKTRISGAHWTDRAHFMCKLAFRSVLGVAGEDLETRGARNPRNPIQKAASSAQCVPGMRFSALDFGGGLYQVMEVDSDVKMQARSCADAHAACLFLCAARPPRAGSS